MTRLIFNGKALQFQGKTISVPTLYDDWFLPVQAALSTMTTVLHNYALGNFSGGYYWASREGTPTTATVTSIVGGSGTSQPKGNVYHVRPMRHFTALEGTYSLRDTGPAGGLIFEIIGTNYYEVWIEDLADSVYSNITNASCNADGAAIGDGEQNTLDIINQASHITSAAKLCADLAVYGSL